jgi:hypothetical protein
MAELSRKRQKLLELFYAEKITAELFADEERRLTETIRSLSEELGAQAAVTTRSTALEQRFEEVAAILTQLEVEQLWNAATEKERRGLVEELLKGVAIFPDHFEVTVAGAPPLNVLSPRLASRSRGLLVSEGGLEPPRPCGHQPLKLARLPIPPLRRGRQTIAASPRRPNRLGATADPRCGAARTAP